MSGVTTAIIAFIFLALAFPSVVKNRSQLYGALVAVLLIILLDASAHVIHTDAYIAFAYCIGGFLQVAAVILIVLSAGGLSAKQFADELGRGFEVLRRGETEKEVIIPLSASAYKAKPEQPAPRRRRDEDEDLPRGPVVLDDPTAVAKSPNKLDSGPLPLE